jgi:hypothetical protein
MNSVESLFAALQTQFDTEALRSSPAWVEPATMAPVDLSRIPPKPWPWPRSMTAVEIAEYEAMLGGEYRVTRGVVTARGDQLWGEPIGNE